MRENKPHSNDLSKLKRKSIGRPRYHNNDLHQCITRCSVFSSIRQCSIYWYFPFIVPRLTVGFRKLLKKHAKWCRLSPNAPYSLSSQFVPRLETKRPFHRRVNFQHILRQLSALYNAKLDPESAVLELSFDGLDEDISGMESCVTYWVHSDNQVETELFLLKHLTLQIPPSTLSSGNIQRCTKTAYLDNENWDVYHSMVPESANHHVEEFPPQIVWEDNTRNNDVVILLPTEEGESRSLQLKRKVINTFLSSSFDKVQTLSDDEEWQADAKYIHDQIDSSSYRPGIIRPISLLNIVIQISSERTGFIKVSRTKNNSQCSRVYATMDTNLLSVRLKTSSPLSFDIEDEELVDLPGYKSVFPHAVLQILWEGDSPRWLEELNGSHLIERVNGFSMYTHSIATLLPSKVSKLPYWVPPS